MVWVALLYAVVGTWLTHLVGRPLAALNFRQQRVEADFRYGLVRVRENMEGIALYGGEAEEKAHAWPTASARVIGNWWAIMQRTKLLNALTAGYDQVAVIFPFVVAAPRYFAGHIPLGGLTQTAGAFGQVQDALSWFVDAAMPDLARVARHRRAADHASIARSWRRRAAAAAGFTLADAPATARCGARTSPLDLPDGAKLLADADLALRAGPFGGDHRALRLRQIDAVPRAGRHLAVRPRPGAAPGRALPVPAAAALYSARHAAARRLPTRTPPGTSPARRCAQALEDAGLAQLVARLDEDEHWAQQLSGGEQQRVALARALLAKPDWLFLDEATASLDPEAEARFYRLLKERLPGTAIVSIAHRPAVAQYHERALRVRDGRLVVAAPAV